MSCLSANNGVNRLQKLMLAASLIFAPFAAHYWMSGLDFPAATSGFMVLGLLWWGHFNK